MAESDESIINSKALELAMEAERERIGRFNLAIVGGTGVGKSSLVNAVFGEARAETGIGMPVSRGISYHVSDTGTFGVWDFEGFEIGEKKDPQGFVAASLHDIAEGDPLRRIAVVWYCVAASAARLTEADLDAIKAFHGAGLKVILVLTKVGRVQHPITRKWSYADDAQAFAVWLANPVDRAGAAFSIPVEMVAFTASVDQGAVGGPAHGLDDLLLATFELSPDGDQDALRVAQRISLPMKRELARRYIAGAAVAAGGAAAQPFPVADAALLAPIQLAMMSKISVAYEVDSGGIMDAHRLAPFVLAFGGKAAARSLIKLIPGVGSMINTAVAVTLTSASGESWRRFCEVVFTGEVDISAADQAWRDYGSSAVEVLNLFVRNKVARGA